MGFKITLVLMVVACLVLDVNAWGWRRRRSSRGRRRWLRRAVRRVRKLAGKVVTYGGKAQQWAGLIGDSKDEMKALREKSEQEYQDMVNKITSEIREGEGEEAAQFTAQLLDQISSKNPEEVSDEMKKKMEAFMDADEQAMDADGEEETEGFDIE